MAVYTGAYDSFGRYRLKLTVNETDTDPAGNSSSGSYVLTLEGAGGYNFNGFTTSGSVVINGYTVASWNQVRPSGAWSGSVTIANGPWTAGHNTNGSKVMAVSASMNASSVPDSYGPGSTMTVSGNLTLTDFARVPTAPPQATVSNITATGAKLDWGASTFYGTGPDYGRYLSTASDFSSMVTSAWMGNVRTVTYTILERGTTYYHRNRAKDSEGTGAYGPTRSFTTLHTKPDQPELLLISKTSTSVWLNSIAAAYQGAGITDRETQLSLSDTFDTVLQSKDVEDPSFTGLSRGTAHYARYRTKNAIGWSDWSATLTVVTDLDPPSAPTGYGVTDLASTTAYTSTPAVADNGGGSLTNVEIQLNTTATATGATTLTRGKYAPIFISGRTAATVYWFRMRVANAGGFGAWGEWVSFTTKGDVPSPPTSVAVGSIGDTTASVSWGAPASLNGTTVTTYTVRVSTTDTFAAASVQTVAASPLALTGLLPGTPHYVQVWSNSPNGVGSYSGIVSFTTTGVAPAPAVRWKRIAGVWKSGVWWKKIPGLGWRSGTKWTRVAGTWRQS